MNPVYQLFETVNLLLQNDPSAFFIMLFQRRDRDIETKIESVANIFKLYFKSLEKQGKSVFKSLEQRTKEPELILYFFSRNKALLDGLPFT